MQIKHGARSPHMFLLTETSSNHTSQVGAEQGACSVAAVLESVESQVKNPKPQIRKPRVKDGVPRVKQLAFLSLWSLY